MTLYKSETSLKIKCSIFTEKFPKWKGFFLKVNFETDISVNFEKNYVFWRVEMILLSKEYEDKGNVSSVMDNHKWPPWSFVNIYFIWVISFFLTFKVFFYKQRQLLNIKYQWEKIVNSFK